MEEPNSATATPSSSTANVGTSQPNENAQVSPNRPRESPSVSIAYRSFARHINGHSAIARDDNCSCLAVTSCFWFFGNQIQSLRFAFQFQFSLAK